MAKKLKKFLKKAGKAAAVAAALYGASKLGKRAKSKAVSGTDDAGLGVSHFKDYITKKAKPSITPNPTDMWDNPWGAKVAELLNVEWELLIKAAVVLNQWVLPKEAEEQRKDNETKWCKK